MDKKSLIAIFVVGALWIAYFIVFKPGEQGKKPVEIKKEEGAATVKNEGREKTGPSAMRINPAATGAKESLIEIKTKKYKFTLSNRGAVISAATYLERDIDLIVKSSPYKTKGIFDFPIHFDDDEFLQGNPLESILWMHKDEDDRVTFSADARLNGSPVRIEKIYTFSEKSNGFEIEYRIKNTGNKEISFKKNSIIISPGDMLGPSLNFDNTYNKLQSIYSIGSSFKQEAKGGGGGFLLGCDSSTSDEPLKKASGAINWAGIMSRYFLIIMIPQNFSGEGIIHDNRKDEGFRTGMYVKMKSLEPGKEVKKSFKVYLGEKEKNHLALFDKTITDAADVNRIIEPIRNFVLWILLKINSVFGNLGWSLVIFSLLTKIVFMPLTIKSNESMKKMQQLTPILNELKVKYKDKPDVMQKEMMKLYKEKGVNPMGGCFPLLLQMPFFFALYSALINSIDLWHAPFIFWMKDLSMPDTVAVISGFSLNILPVVMTATTILQQKLSTVDTGGQQKMMMMMMPLVFIYIFWSMPSGLVLYWALQNIFQILQQLFINYRAKSKES